MLRERQQEGKMPLEEFKRLATSVYSSRLFRASNKWCDFFIRKNALTHLVQLS
jgi:hypothetical protein